MISVHYEIKMLRRGPSWWDPCAGETMTVMRGFFFILTSREGTWDLVFFRTMSVGSYDAGPGLIEFLESIYGSNLDGWLLITIPGLSMCSESFYA